MKTLNLKMLAVAGMVTAFSAAGTPVSNAENAGRITSPPARYLNGNSQISNDLLSISATQHNINMLKDRIKADCKAGLKTAEIRDKSELSKLYADRGMEKQYLLADKKAYIKSYSLAISDRRSAWNADRRKLYASERKLRRDVFRENDNTLQLDAAAVADDQKLLKKDEMALRTEKLYRDADMLAMNKDIRKVDAEPVTTTMAENTYTDFDRWLQK